MAAPPTEAELTRSATTIDSLPVEILTEVLLRVPTPAALVHAAAASRSWRGAIAAPEFLTRYRKRHKSSPFLGLYIPRQICGNPTFIMPDSIESGASGGDLKHAMHKAAIYNDIHRHQDHRRHDAIDNAVIFGPLGGHSDCRLLDCHNSRLLLTRGDEALEVRSPLARESILLPFPSDVHPDSLEASLLQGHDEAAVSFRVVYLQHRREGRNRQARAVEYDSTRKSWQEHSWKTIKERIEGPPGEVMHAGHRMFCRYRGRSQAALMLDTRKMEFSVLTLPTDVNFAIGEIEDNVCCLVESIDNRRFKVWKLDEEKLEWKDEKDISLDQVLAIQYRVGYYRPRAINNGIALVCSTTLDHHFVLDLKTCSLMDMFEFQGRSAYIMQMPWPPAFCHLTAMNPGSSKDGNSENQHELRDGAWLSNEPQYLDIPSNERQYLDIQGPTTIAPTSAIAEQCFGKDKNYVPNDYLIPDMCGQFSDLVHPEVIGSHHPERRNLLIRLEQGARCHPKYCVKDPEDITMESQDPKVVAPTPEQITAIKVLSTGQVPAEFAVPKPDANMAEASEGAEKMHKDDLNQESEADGQKQDKKSPPTRRVNDAQERRGERDRARWHAMPREKRNEKNKRRREAYMIKQKQQPNIKNININAMNPGSREEIQHGLRDGAAALNYMLSNEPQDLDIQDPTATAPTAPPAAPAVEQEEPFLRVRSLNDLMRQPPTLASCPQQGGSGKLDGSRGGKGSHEATTGQGRRQKMPNTKYRGAEWLINDDWGEL